MIIYVQPTRPSRSFALGAGSGQCSRCLGALCVMSMTHKGLEGEADLLAVNVAYYFATNPDLYRSTTVVNMTCPT